MQNSPPADFQTAPPPPAWTRTFAHAVTRCLDELDNRPRHHARKANNHPRMKPRMHEYRAIHSSIREIFVDGLFMQNSPPANSQTSPPPVVWTRTFALAVTRLVPPRPQTLLADLVVG